ncbi:Glucose--fructose oxidoreductase [Ensifer sp. M14]|uniref:Gfo/Idh/MocA family protein n=1 Tax=Ensifer sp. M14 TaxID=2203782 RepID=UPI000E1DFDF3|nr:Gfo/Idh/MocA family oxidoreductase [Ensifer sp. M14]RDL50686.1 Glucose--fructose oxidoreductase [Ensifer sp. M14]
MKDKVRWGIAGTGVIANSFASDIQFAGNAVLAAVYSRSQDKADAFAERFGGIARHSSIDAFAADPEIDAVYVASPNAVHLEHAIVFLSADKAVLVEKPLTTSFDDARSLSALAAAKGLFAMEGLWTCFLPAIAKARALLDGEALGRIRHVTAELAYEKPFDPTDRFFDARLGGGSLLDLGIYPLSLCLNLFGRPHAIDGRWQSAPTGVDLSAEMRLAYAGFNAHLSCGFDRDGDNRFVIDGDRGTLVIDAPFLKASRLFLANNGLVRKAIAPRGRGLWAKTLTRVARRVALPGLQRFDLPFPGNGLQFEIEAASAAILEGWHEHILMPTSRSIQAIEIIETIRALPPS